jgi:outer membrane protein
MKRILTILLIAAACFPGVALKAQNYKFGHIETQGIIILMPEYKKAGDSLNVVREKYELQAEKMQVDINKKYNELLEEKDTIIQETLYSEFQNMQERSQNFQATVTQKLRSLEGSLLQDVMAVLTKAIDEVAGELDLIYVFDISGRNPIYTSDKSIDIGPMVKEKMGIQ